MQFEWDEAKRQANIIKHKIDFAEAVTIFDGFVHTHQDLRADYGEDRYVCTGLLNGIEITVIYTPRNEKKRIISVRRARKKEREDYYAERKQKMGY